MTKATPTGIVRVARRNPVVRFLARAGFAVNGILHGVIGVLALQLAIGTPVHADPGGALSGISATPGGVFVLWAIVVGLFFLGAWLILGAFLIKPSDPKKRTLRTVMEVGKGVAYLALCVAAFGAARSGGPNNLGDSMSLSARLMASPGGLFVVLLIGIGILVVGGYFVVKGVRRRFLEDVDLPDGRAGTAVTVLGVWGYVSKGIALAIVGILFIGAAVTTDPTAATGLDGALKSLFRLPFGPQLVGVIGGGFIAYGAYCLVRARFARI